MTITTAKRPRSPAAGAAMRPLAAPVALLALLMAPAARAELKVAPALALRAIYTDNVRLEADQFKQSQFITELSPSLALTSNSPRLKLRASFASHLYAYLSERPQGTKGSSRDLSADARAKLIDELLFFDGTAAIRQQPVSQFGPRGGDNNYSAANRNEVRSWRASPYLKHRFGSAADAELRYTRDSLKSSSAALGASSGNTVALSIASGASFRSVGWALSMSRQDSDDSLGRKARADTADARLRLRVNNELSVNAALGYDKYDFGDLGGSNAGASSSAGVTWTPSPRTSIDASAGRRFFGTTYALNALHRSRHTVWNANYSDGVTTSRAQFLGTTQISTVDVLERLFAANFPDPQERRQVVDAYIRANGLPPTLPDDVNFISNRYLRQKQLQASAAFRGVRSTAIVSVSAAERRALASQQSDSALPASGVQDDSRHVAATLTLNYRLSPRSGINAALSRTRTTSLSSAASGDQNLLTVALTRQFQRSIRGSVELRHSQGRSVIAGGHTYRENAVSASLSYQL